MKFYSIFCFLLKSSIRELAKRWMILCPGVLAIMISVILASLAQALIKRAPIIFYKRASLEYGDYDMQIWPKEKQGYFDQSSTYFLNISTIAHALAPLSDLHMSGRSYLKGIVTSEPMKELSNVKINLKNKEFAGKSIIKTQIVFYDPYKEFKVNPTPSFLKYNISDEEVIITKSIANKLDLDVGSTLHLRYFDPERIEAIDGYYEKVTGRRNGERLDYLPVLPFKVKLIIDKMETFENDGAGIEVLLNGRDFCKRLSAFYKDQHKSNFLWNLNILEFSTKVVFNYEDRLEIYMTGDYNRMLTELTTYYSKVIDILGLSPVNIHYPILSDLREKSKINMIGKIIIDLLVIGFSCLSFMIINNLIEIAVFSRQRYFAFQRMLGLTKIQLIIICMMNGVLLSFISLGLALPILIKLIGLINFYAFHDMPELWIKLTMSEIYTAMAISFITPQISYLIPIRDQFKDSLFNQIHHLRSQSQKIRLLMRSGDHGEIIKTLSFASFISVVIGYFLYLGVPYAQLTGDLQFLAVFTLILLVSMLMGFIYILFSLSFIFENLLAHLLIFDFSYIRHMVRMNLTGQRKKNRKVMLKLGISSCLITFFYLMVLVKEKIAVDDKLNDIGGTLTIFDQNIYTLKRILDSEDLKKYFSLKTVFKPFENFDQKYVSQSFSNLGGLFEYPELSMLVSPDYLKGLERPVQQYAQRQLPTSLDPVEYSFTRFGREGVITSVNLVEKWDLKIDKPPEMNMGKIALLRTKHHPKRIEINTDFLKIGDMSSMILQLNAYAKRIPGLFLTDYHNEFLDQKTMLLSPEVYFRLFHEVDNNFEKILIDKTILLIKPEWEHLREMIVDKLERACSKFNARLFNYDRAKQMFSGTESLTLSVFLAASVLAFIISFFAIVSNNIINFNSQRMEIAILRSLGVTKKSILRVYVYQNIIITAIGVGIGILASCITGFIILKIDSLLRRNTYALVLPWQNLSKLTLGLCFTTIFVTVIQTVIFLKKPIADTFRGTDV